jgi:hypothetical protein
LDVLPIAFLRKNGYTVISPRKTEAPPPAESATLPEEQPPTRKRKERPEVMFTNKAIRKAQNWITKVDFWQVRAEVNQKIYDLGDRANDELLDILHAADTAANEGDDETYHTAYMVLNELLSGK